MSAKLVFDNIEKHIQLSDSERSYLDELFVVKKIRKNEFLLHQGDIAHKIFFVESGSLRGYHCDDSGKESTIMFAVSDWWITDINSFANQRPSIINIVALEDSEAIKLDARSLNDLYLKLPKFERFFRILFQNAYIREQQRAYMKIAYSTEENYKRFLIKYPHIVEKISQKQIASYLGVTPEFLSAIKKSSSLKLS